MYNGIVKKVLISGIDIIMLRVFENFCDKVFQKDTIGEPPYEYDFLVSLDEKEYPKYLKKIFKTMTGESLNLKHPKTFNEKIQWLKLYDSSPLKTQLTDKVLVRDYVKEKIGEEYLKPICQICDSFDEIDFDKLPQAFIIKCNHGCKWHYKIKDKKRFLENKHVFSYVRDKFNFWMTQQFHLWGWFELQYKGIKPKIIVEDFIGNLSEPLIEYEVYCFNGIPKISRRVKFGTPGSCNTLYDENFEIMNEQLYMAVINEKILPEPELKKAVELSKILAKGFKFVRVDWIANNSKLYFNEMTFSPMSGFFNFSDFDFNLKLGSMLKIKD